MGGLGGGTAWNTGELVEIASQGILHSQIGQVLIEESILGWQEFSTKSCETPMRQLSVPWRTSTRWASILGNRLLLLPAQTLSDRDHQGLRDAALRLIRRLDIKGGCNVQFTVNQDTGEFRVIEVNPRVSRSSALASKATGYPIARMAALIAVPATLWMNCPIQSRVKGPLLLSNRPWIMRSSKSLGGRLTSSEPRPEIGTSMKSTGEVMVMAIGRNFEEAFLKAIASLEYGQHPPSAHKC